MELRFLTLPLIAASLLLPAPLWGDIYRQVDDDGVERFTDTPNDRRYSLFMKEGKPAARHGRRPAPHPNATGNDSAADAPLSSPLPEEPQLPVRGRITSLTGLRVDPLDGKLRHHNGIDIAVAAGTPVKPVAAGTVTFSGVRPGYGNTVIVDHNDGTLTLYAHNSENLVAAGDPVDRGTVLALTGATGRTTGPHLHFEAWRDGINVTRSYIPGAATPSALATAEAPIHRILQPDGTLLFTNLR